MRLFEFEKKSLSINNNKNHLKQPITTLISKQRSTYHFVFRNNLIIFDDIAIKQDLAHTLLSVNIHIHACMYE